MSATAEAEVTSVAAASLGGPGPADPACCALAAIDALKRAAGPGMGLTSLTLDVASHPLGAGEVAIRTRADKRTRAILFASVEARIGDVLVFSAQGLFSKTGAST